MAHPPYPPRASNNAYVYTWNFDGGVVVASNSNTGGPYKITWSTPGLHIIQASTKTIEGCTSITVPDTINIEPLPEVRISIVNAAASVCAGDSVELKTDFVGTGYSYTWTPAPFFNVNNLPDIFGNIQLPGYVSLTVKDELGCKASDSVLIDAQPCCGVFFPTAFTPNNDGRNDVFRPVMAGHHTIHAFRIVDRWGQQMYNSDDGAAGWNGNANGVPQDMGVYFYFIRYDCNGNIMEEKGEVTLIR